MDEPLDAPDVVAFAVEGDDAVASGSPRPPPRALIVDDEQLNRMLLRSVLAGQSVECLEASSGAEALALLDAGERIDLILLDVVMPGMGGIELCQRIKGDRKLLFLPIILITALADTASRIAGKAAGADEFLSRPVDALELTARVRVLLDAKSYHDLRIHHQQRLEEELARARASLLQADRLATVCNLAAATSHEMKNMLVVLNGTIEGIRRATTVGVPTEPKRLEALQMVAAHLLSHARQLDGVGRQVQDSGVVRFDFGAFIGSTIDMLRVAVPKATRFVLRTPAEPVVVVADRTRVQQVLVNLVYNAVAACEGAGRDPVISVVLEADGAYATCRVSDNGPGILPEVMPKLFEMYFTTKPAGKGSGIGLAVARSIIETAGGQLRAASPPGSGATFTFTIPAQRPS